MLKESVLMSSKRLDVVATDVVGVQRRAHGLHRRSSLGASRSDGRRSHLDTERDPGDVGHNDNTAVATHGDASLRWLADDEIADTVVATGNRQQRDGDKCDSSRSDESHFCPPGSLVK